MSNFTFEHDCLRKEDKIGRMLLTYDEKTLVVDWSNVTNEDFNGKCYYEWSFNLGKHKGGKAWGDVVDVNPELSKETHTIISDWLKSLLESNFCEISRECLEKLLDPKGEHRGNQFSLGVEDFSSLMIV